MMFDQLPDDIEKAAKEATLNLLPEKSRKRYEEVYCKFNAWRESKKINMVCNEKVMLAYFSERSQQVKSSSLWSEYSMIRSTLLVHENVDVKLYPKLLALLKKNSVGYRAKKSKVLSEDDIARFINDAPDDKYLSMKVVALFGIFGACRRDELCKMEIGDIDDQGNLWIIRISYNKTDKPRSFVICGEIGNANAVNICKKYASLRPIHTKHNRFFVYYFKGKCSVQPIGLNTIGKVPREIASFLKLEDPQSYTGHCFRRTSATLLVDKGGDITTLKRHGGWKSSTVAESYIEESVAAKVSVANLLNKGDSSTASISYENQNNVQVSLEGMLPGLPPHVNINNYSGSNVTINMHVK